MADVERSFIKYDDDHVSCVHIHRRVQLRE